MRSSGARWVVAAAVLWSSGGLFIKLVPASGLAVAFGRALVTTVFYLLVLRPRLSRARIGTAVAYAGMIVTFVTATKLTTAANAVFLQYTGPAYVLALAPVVLREPFRRIDLFAVVASLAGMALFFVEPSAHASTVAAGSGAALGNLLAVVSGGFFAWVVLQMRRDAAGEGGDSLPSVTLGNLLATVGLAPFVWRELPAMAAPAALGALLYLGVVQMGLAYLCFGRGLKTTAAATASLVAMLEPVLNPLWVFLGTHERPSPWALVGGTIVIGAVAIRTWLTRADQGPGARSSGSSTSPAASRSLR